MKTFLTFFIATFLGFASSALTATNLDPGSLDDSFTVTNSGIYGNATCFAIQPDGQILVGGWYGIYRLRVDGTTDSTFKVWTDSLVEGVRVASNGVIVAFGNFHTANGTPVPGLAKFQNDGTLMDFNLSVFPAQSVRDAIPLENGKVLIAGWFTNINGRIVQGLVRLNPDGSRDESFGTTNLKGPTYRIALGPDHSLWVLIPGLSLLRLMEDGRPDPNFKLSPDPLGSSETTVLGIQKDGKAIVGGYLQAVGSSGTDIVRVNTNGTVDTNFIFRPVGKWISSLDFQPDGKVLIGGGFLMSNGVSGVARLWPSGELDTNFFTSIPGGSVRQIMRHPDGRVLVAGDFQNVNSSPRRSPARLWGDPFRLESVNAHEGSVQFRVPLGSVYALQFSQDLKTWDTLVTDQAVAVPIIYTPPIANHPSRGYYRVQILR
jgi:uncharacterized delta-60 repeat protein